MPAETIEEPAAQKQPVNPAEQANQKEALLREAQELLAAGNPWLAMVKKSEAIGLKPLATFASMAKQDFATRPDLKNLGFPLSDVHRRNFYAEATATLFPAEEGGDATHKAIVEAAKRTVGEPPSTAQEQASKAQEDIYKKAFELQAQRAFGEVGHYYVHAGYAAARAGNGDLLVADANDERLQELKDAGYTPSLSSMNVPFSADVSTREDVGWGIGQTEANERLNY